jgi:hypothetical protein
MYTKVNRECASVDKMIIQERENMHLELQHIHEEMDKKLQRKREQIEARMIHMSWTVNKIHVETGSKVTKEA